MGATLGYARVSTTRQRLDQQLDELQRAGVPAERIYVDKMSGKRDDRPGLAALLDYAREGDTIVVIALDRLGRSLSGIIRTLGELTERGVMIRSLREGIDYSTPLAEWSPASSPRSPSTSTASSTSAPRRPARPPAPAASRPAAPALSLQTRVRQARRLRDAGESIADIQATLGCARSTLYRALSQPA